MLISPAYAQAGQAAEPNMLVTFLPLIAIFAIFYFEANGWPEDAQPEEENTVVCDDVELVSDGAVVDWAVGLWGKELVGCTVKCDHFYRGNPNWQVTQYVPGAKNPYQLRLQNLSIWVSHDQITEIVKVPE